MWKPATPGINSAVQTPERGLRSGVAFLPPSLSDFPFCRKLSPFHGSAQTDRFIVDFDDPERTSRGVGSRCDGVCQICRFRRIMLVEFVFQNASLPSIFFPRFLPISSEISAFFLLKLFVKPLDTTAFP